MVRRLIALAFTCLTLLNYVLVQAQDITIETTRLLPSECSGRFIEHVLDYTTTPSSLPIKLFESNGSGLAVNDLNQDGWIDIVLANLYGNSTILWNEGDLHFRKQELVTGGRTRAVTIVDVD